jgi:hypothetical protein
MIQIWCEEANLEFINNVNNLCFMFVGATSSHTQCDKYNQTMPLSEVVALRSANHRPSSGYIVCACVSLLTKHRVIMSACSNLVGVFFV